MAAGVTMDERRRTARTLPQTDDALDARIRPGHQVSVVDVSGGGTLIETARRLLPGSTVELQLESRRRQTTIRGHVVRCSIVAVRPTSLCYRAAIAFDHTLPWFMDDGASGYGVPGAKTHVVQSTRVETTPTVL